MIYNFPEEDIRIRREDKGSRFCFIDGETEDRLIEQELGNSTFYTPLLSDPTEEFKTEVVNWADKHLDEGNISNDMHKFATDIKDSHPANPKPL